MNEALLSRGCSCRACAERLDAPLPTYPRWVLWCTFLASQVKAPGTMLWCACCAVQFHGDARTAFTGSGRRRSPLRPPNINKRNGLLDTLAGIHVRDHPGDLPPTKDG